MNLIGEVKDRTCLLVDDMVDTAGTLCKAADALKERGASKVSRLLHTPGVVWQRPGKYQELPAR